ncbi:MAG: Uncharacterised protein [Hyphomonas sp. TMED17]|nr:MAG: Uncharacterised protein [Hyphomonas sp. TMED17]
MTGLAVIGVDNVTGAATGCPVIAWLVICTKEPSERIIQTGFVNVENRDCHPQAGAWPPVGLTDIGPARLFDSLQLAERIRQADFRELSDDIAAAAFEYAEDVGWRNDVPSRHWQ